MSRRRNTISRGPAASATKRQSNAVAMVEPLETRRLLTAAIAPLASGISTGATDLGSIKLKSGHSAKGVVGVLTTDTVYKVELTAEVNLGITLSHLLQKDKVYLMYADGTLVNSGYSNSKPTLSVSQHLDPGTYFIDIQHGFIAGNTVALSGPETGATPKVTVTKLKHYKIAATDGFVLAVKGLKPDDSIAPQETVKPTAFSAAFGATGANAEPAISAALQQSSGFTGYQAFTTAEGYQLWGTAGPSPDDVVQQYIGDCYYMSIISSIARDDPGLIEKDIVAESDGDYLVKFSSNGQEVDEQVDDTLPVNANGQTVFAGIPSDKNIWVGILEKAWTYFRPDSTSPDSYDGIQSGLPSESLKAFGSTDATDVLSNTYNTAPALLTAISTRLQAGDLVDIGTQSPQNWPSSDPPLASGLFTGHAYSVVKVDVASNQIELRNPWATNTQGQPDDGTGGYITITGDQLEQSIDVFSYGSLAGVTPDPTPTPTPSPTPTPTPTPTTTATTTQTVAGDLGPNSYQTTAGSNYDFFTFTADTAGSVEITIATTVFTPQLLIAEDGTNGWTTVSSDTNSGGTGTADVTFTAAAGVTYGIGVFCSGTTDTGAYTLTLNGDVSAPVQSTPDASTGSLSGTVFNDSNANGVQDAGEVGIAGVSVYIDLNGTGTFADGDPVATTDANGVYTFTALQPGSYTVLVEQADGYTQTAPAGNAGVTGTVTAGVDTAVAAVGESTGAGDTVSGTVYGDTNGDGVQDSGETGLAGWYVYVDLGNTGQYTNGDPYTVTDANGNYSFQGAAPGTYTLRVYPQSGYTTTQGGNGLTATVSTGQGASGENFGESQPAGTVTGVVYLDTNDDGAQDSGETGAAGWQVYIDVGNTGSYVSGDPTATTDSTGTYTFTGLAAGTYVVRVVPQSGYSTYEGSEGWTATVAAGATVNGGSFGEAQATGGIYGTVYDDLNADGTQDGYEAGLYNWAVYVDLDNSGQYETADPYVITDGYGGYSITGLAPGTYTVRAYVYSGTRWTPTEGSDGWSITVVSGQDTFSGDFGEHY